MGASEQGSPARVRVIYSGRVQGVFFRATAYEIARDRAVTGFVRNMADGTVELEAQGAAEEVERLLLAIGERYEGNIAGAARSPLAAIGNEREFEIRY